MLAAAAFFWPFPSKLDTPWLALGRRRRCSALSQAPEGSPPAPSSPALLFACLPHWLCLALPVTGPATAKFPPEQNFARGRESDGSATLRAHPPADGSLSQLFFISLAAPRWRHPPLWGPPMAPRSASQASPPSNPSAPLTQKLFVFEVFASKQIHSKNLVARAPKRKKPDPAHFSPWRVPSGATTRRARCAVCQ